MSTITKDGFLIDDETGEVLGHAEKPAAFVVTDRKGAEWVLEKMQVTDFDIAALEGRRKAICSNIDKQIAALRRRRQWLDMRFLSDLKEFTKSALEGMKTKTFPTPFGKMALKRTVPRLIVTDEQKALEWAVMNAPDAVKVSRSVLISGLAGRDDLPATAFEMTVAEERFSIDTGVKAMEISDED